MASGSGLSVEQKQRMEENRRKALALREQRLKQQKGSGTFNVGGAVTAKAPVTPQGGFKSFQGVTQANKSTQGASSIVRPPQGASSIVKPPQGASSIVKPPQGACSIVKPPQGACSIVRQPQGASSIVKPPQGASSIVKPPQGASSIVKPPQGASTIVKPPQGACSIVKPPQGACSIVKPSQKGPSFVNPPQGGATTSRSTGGIVNANSSQSSLKTTNHIPQGNMAPSNGSSLSGINQGQAYPNGSSQSRISHGSGLPGAQAGSSSSSQPNIKTSSNFYSKSSTVPKNNNNTAASFQKTPVGSAAGIRASHPVSKDSSTIYNLWNTGGDGSKAGPSSVPAGSAAKNFLSGKNKVKGSCILQSRSRFEVQIGYSAAVIEIFKSMNSKMYDPVTKLWSFELSEYSKFIEKMSGLRGAVEIEGLPRAVQLTFSKQISGHIAEREIPEADLSGVDDHLVENLMPFQREGINFSIWRRGRVLIADDMGLGKTIQAICVASYYREEWPLLVVTPSSVRFAWADQIQKWLPSMDPQQINVVTKGSDKATTGLVNIISYDLMARKLVDLQRKQFQVIIMDESHLLKNQKTVRAKAAVPLLRGARHVLLLTGTPALSRPSELYTQISVIDPKLFPRFQDFGVRYCAGKEMPWGWDFTGSSNMGELQLLLEERIMIRRLKENVIKQLPSKIRQMVLLDPSSIKKTKDLKAFGSKMDTKSLKGMERRGALLEYFHATGTAKLNAVKEYVGDLLEGDQKFLVFAHHQDVMDALEETVKKKKFKHIRIEGSTPSEQRNFLVQRFQLRDEYRVAILSITAANAGLNLTSAKMVVFAELFWNPGILVQAEDRAHRIGQEDSVSVHYLVAPGTADDHLWPLIQNKLEVLSKVGLSRNDFKDADTKVVRDHKQSAITEFFEQSFLEDIDFSQAVEAGEEVDKTKDHESPSKNQHGILKYFSPSKQTGAAPSGAGENQEVDDDVSQCFLLEDDDDDWDTEPMAKKMKT